jgi:hypothetical protein
MKIDQISVFLENRAGRLRQVCEVMGKNDINIRALTVAETQAFGVLRLVVDKTEQALKVLKEGGFTANRTDVVVVEVEDRPSGLADGLGVLENGKVNVEYMYAFLERNQNKALLVFRFDDIESAISLLKSNNIRVVSNSDF